MKYLVSHRTVYEYSEDVRNSLGLAHVAPRPVAWQQIASHDVTIDPEPNDVSHERDAFGNVVTYFHVTAPHQRLIVDARTDVTVDSPRYDDAALALPWELSRPLHTPDTPGAWSAAEFAVASPKAEHVAEAHTYAAATLTPGRSIGEAATDLMHRIKADFDYDKTATTVTSSVAEVLRTRAGVCQDFAHLALACLRSHGVAARYVSGYLATQPPPGRERIVGADASHAWLAVWLPGSDEWLAIDPTNDQWANDRYVTVAWGGTTETSPPSRGSSSLPRSARPCASRSMSPRHRHPDPS
ncbi:transglutaminase family protein [Microbacterium schleiferi]|uniref:transglutaminase family protein n=1 Tax=Microbacterium schleiferi TaxID=69362 RepID=UPI001E2C7051|nr:transglutaminase family protein [Microbacterium schleiferi]